MKFFATVGTISGAKTKYHSGNFNIFPMIKRDRIQPLLNSKPPLFNRAVQTDTAAAIKQEDKKQNILNAWSIERSAMVLLKLLL